MARHDLGLGDREFWRLSPRQYAALLDRHRRADERHDRRAALVAAVIANANRGQDQPPFAVDDFMPRRAGFGDRRAVRGDVQTPEQQYAVIEQLKAIFGGV